MAPDRASLTSNPATVSTTHPSTPITPDLSRPRLKQITQWIRDELDIRVARDGSDVLRPDDVLTLHETFIALQHARNITVSDLRATGIHKAVQNIAGVATRWPGRLCDDCDRIIDIWTAKFGRFSEIHPFLFGRGGRLEGIASIHEYSREALLKRWASTCPEKIHPKRSHRLGSLGFVAGSWWINPLFAHHAGIIGLEACDGGTTYDKHGAYALLLKDTGELEASCESRFTYRVPQNDKGKFRLTSATPRSRDPVRVLRSHSINSIWGPKAGVRYEGLYSVRGWSIKQAKSTDTAGGQWKEGDILFDVRFERTDQVPMEVVITRPTATEVDDYAEYKRLRKLNRDGKQKEAKATSYNPSLHPVAKPLSPVMPLPSPLAAPKQLVIDSPPSALRKDMVKRLHFDEEAHIHVIGDEEALSPRSAPDMDPMKVAALGKSKKLTVSSQSSQAATHSKADLSVPDAGGYASPAGSNTSSSYTMHTTKTAASTKPNVDIRQVAPWIDYDANLSLPSPSEESLIVHQRPIITRTITSVGPLRTQGTKSLFTKSRERLPSPEDSPNASSSAEPRPDDKHEKKNDGDTKGLPGDMFSAQNMAKRHKRKSVAMRKRTLMAKLFDGVLDDDSEGDGTFWETRTGLSSADPSTPQSSLQERESRYKDMSQLHPHSLPRPCSPDSPLKLARRNAICSIDEPTCPLAVATTPDTSRSSIIVSIPHEDPFIESPAPRRPKALPMSMKNLMSQSTAVTTVGSVTCMPVLGRSESPQKHIDEDSLAETRLRKMVGQLQPLEIKMAFKNPFDDSNGVGEGDCME